jgi:predicted nucleotidyltransferase
MGTTLGQAPSGLADALFTPVQQRLLGLLFGQPDRRFQSAELIRLVGSGTGTAHRNLTRLATAGLITVTRTSNQKHYQANRESPIFGELHGLAIKTVGMVEPIRRALQSRTSEIHAAFVYGSIARGADTAASDVDLVVVSDTLGYAEVFEALQSAEAVLSRPINPSVMTLTEWRARTSAPGSFTRRVAQGHRLFVIGSDHDLA